MKSYCRFLLFSAILFSVANSLMAEEQPDWMANPLAEELRVPKPFEPVTTTANEVALWGRKFIYNNSLFPVQIISQDRELLAGPIRVFATLNGKTYETTFGNVKVTEAIPARVTLTGHNNVSEALFTAHAQIEFDGLHHTKLIISPNQEGVQLTALKFEIPLRPEAATLMHRSQCVISAPSWSGATPDKWSSDFIPVMWLGNEHVGICWFFEHTSYWRNQNLGKRFHVAKSAEATLFTLNMVEGIPLAINQPVTYELGFSVTPTKPMPTGWLADKPISLDPWWDESNQFLHEAIPYEEWIPYAKKVHANGGKQLKYTQTNFLSFYGDLSAKDILKKKRPGERYFNTPEKIKYKEEWKKLPVHQFSDDAQVLCSNSNWRHLIIAGIYERLKNSGFDGLYFDCSMPYRCNNTAHGCHWKYDMLGQRDLRRRIYNIFDELGLEGGVIFEHISGNMLGPQMNFATCHYDGEQYSSYVQDYCDILSLERMRAFSIGTNWGHKPYFMAFSRGGNAPTESLMAIWSLHMPWYAVKGWVSPPGAAARNLEKQFQFDEKTERLGYWENSILVSGQDENIKATVYRKPDLIFLVVSNLSKELVDAVLKLDIAGLGLDPAQAGLIKSIEIQDKVPTLENGVFSTPIRPHSCVMSIIGK